jgi:hypothetical protein
MKIYYFNHYGQIIRAIPHPDHTPTMLASGGALTNWR